MNTKNTGLLAMALIVVLGVGVVLLSSKDKEKIKVSPVINNKEVTSAPKRYKNGAYEQKGDYVSPGGPEQIEVTLTLLDGVVTEVNVIPQAENPKSVSMQGIFVENYKPLVVGKNIKDLNLGKVAGSSLTPKGFNDAIAKIKAIAQT